MSAGKYFGSSCCSSCASCAEFSDIFTITRLPAASAPIIGCTAMAMGKFHGTTMPTTPSGCGCTKARASGYWVMSSGRRCRFIQRGSCLIASSAASWPCSSSVIRVSKRLRQP